MPLEATAFTVPEGFALDDTSMASFLGIMNDQSMDAAGRAQALINLQASLATQASEAGSREWNDRQASWQAEVQADPEIGGPNLEKTIANIGQLMTRFGNDEVRRAFDQTGAGNNPHIVRFLNSLHAQLREPGPVNPGGPAAGGAPLSLAERIYGK